MFDLFAGEVTVNVRNNLEAWGKLFHLCWQLHGGRGYTVSTTCNLNKVYKVEAELPLTEFRQSLSHFCTTKPFNDLLTASTESLPPLSEEQVNFTGGQAFSAPGKMYLTGVEGRPCYVGEVSDEVDENWKLLVDGSTIALSYCGLE